MKGYQLARQLQRERKYQEALSVLLENEDDGDCCYFLAYLYEKGYWGLPVDYTKRDFWLNKGILLGHDKCDVRQRQQYRRTVLCGDLFYKGENSFCKATIFDIQGNWQESLEYYKKSLIEDGDDFACKNVLCNFWFRDVVDDRIFWAKKGMEMGNIESFYFYGQYLSKNHDPTYIDYFKISAEQGCASSLKYVVDYFIKNKDIGRAYNWYKGNPYDFRSVRHHHEILKKVEQCQRVCYQLLMIRNFRESNLSVLPKDVVRLLAKILWNTKEEECWELKNRVSPAILRKKRRIKKSI